MRLASKILGGTRSVARRVLPATAFHFREWDHNDGFVHRSTRYDERNAHDPTATRGRDRELPRMALLCFLRSEFALIVLILGGLLFNPYEFAVNDHTYKIPLLITAFDDTLYARDITINVEKAHYISYFYLLGYPLMKAAGLEIAFFIIYALTQTLFYLSIYLIAVRLSNEKIVGLMAVLLLMFARPALGGIATFDSIVEERAVAFSLLLLAIYLLIARQYWLAGLVSACAASIHLITAVNVGLFIAMFFAARLMFRDLRKESLRGCLCYFPLLFLGALPVIVKKMLGEQKGDIFQRIDPDWLRMILQRSSPHFLPNYQEFRFMLLLACVVFVLFLASRLLKKSSNPEALILYGAAFVTMLLGFALAVYFVDVDPILLGLQLSFLRASELFVVLSYVMLAVLMFRLFSFNKVILFLVFFLAVFFCFRQFEPAYHRNLLAGACIIVLIVEIARRKWPRLSAAHPRYGIGEAVILMVLFALLLVRNGTDIQVNNPFKADQNDNIDAQLWLAEHSDKNALVMVPPNEKDFRIHSKRSTLGSWKDWTFNCLDREFAFAMHEHLRDLANLDKLLLRHDQGKAYYQSLKDDELLRIAHKYHADYIVSEKRNSTLLRPVYENAKYVIFQVPQHSQPTN